MKITFEKLADWWRRDVAVHHKPSTRKRDASSLRTQLLPRFGKRLVGEIDRSAVYRWYIEYSRGHLAGANRALCTLSGIFRYGLAAGWIDANPCAGIKTRNVPRRDRWLSAAEIGRLNAALDAYAKRLPSNGARRGVSGRQCVDILRLLLLTGCRCSEISQLRWIEVMPGRLALLDSKTGARTVPLGTEAEEILARQPSRGRSAWVFPEPADPAQPRSRHISMWLTVRKAAGLEDVRIHDLRHTWASHAVMSGIPLTVLARILGHSSTRITGIHAHIADRTASDAAQSAATRMAAMMAPASAEGAGRAEEIEGR